MNIQGSAFRVEGERNIASPERALELIDFTARDEKNRKRLKELLRTREAIADNYFYFDNEYQSNDRIWQKYFLNFAFAARLKR